MKYLCLYLLLLLPALSAEKPGFTGCGDYVLKGVLIKNPLVYVVRLNAKSEMTFTFTEQDVSLVSSYIDVPTTMKVKILKKMDGTKGEISEVNGVSIRKPNPKDPYSDSGIFFQSRRSCQQ